MTFDVFYSIFPRRLNRKAAEKAYNIAIKNGASHEAIERGAYEYAAWCERNATAKQFICHPATWLNGERWLNNYRADDTQGNSDNGRASRTGMAISAAVKAAQALRAKMALEVER